MILQKYAELIDLYNGKKMHDKALDLLHQYAYHSLLLGSYHSHYAVLG